MHSHVNCFNDVRPNAKLLKKIFTIYQLKCALIATLNMFHRKSGITNNKKCDFNVALQ